MNYERAQRGYGAEHGACGAMARVKQLATCGPPPTGPQRLRLAVLARKAGLACPHCRTEEAADLEIARLSQVCELQTVVATS